MTEEKSGTPQETETAPERALALPGFGDRRHVRELADRLKFLLVGGRKLEPSERLALAQIAVAHDLDPTIGEIWYIPGSGPMIGIKGLRKEARRQSKEEATTYWLEESRLDPSEVGAPADAVVFQIVLRDSATVSAYAKAINSLTSASVPYADAIDLLGPPPKYIGVGIATPNEKSKMSITARARKRAEAEALKQRFDVEFAGVRGLGPGDEPEIVPADFQIVDGGDETEGAESGPIGRTVEDSLTDLGY